MTIGAYDRDPSTENPDFVALVECKRRLCDQLKLPWDRIELSMGMSSDYEQAVRFNCSNVRVNRTILSSRSRWEVQISALVVQFLGVGQQNLNYPPNHVLQLNSA